MVPAVCVAVRKQHCKTPETTAGMTPLVPQIITRIRRFMQCFMVPPEPVTCGLLRTLPRPKMQLGAQNSAGAIDTLWL
jgi:hypothetical protein